MGRALGCLGHVSMLRRIAVGPFTEAHMISLEKLEELRHKAPGGNAMEGALLPIETVLDGIPALAIDGRAGPTPEAGTSCPAQRRECSHRS